ncbi:MAG: nucleoside phosphorylase [Verrucomicrobia bacterium]|nr:nucleoside phosphorylase [Verrucomicrobiota bacterium]
MSFPNYRDKHQFDALISPIASFDYQKQIGRIPEGPCPKRVILCYQKSFMDRITETFDGHYSSGAFRRLYWLTEEIAIGEYGIGAPRAVLSLEMLIAWGVKDFISIGTAGAIAPDLKIGDLIGCDRAIRDEGTSHHYLPAGRYSNPTDQGRFAKKFSRIGTTWTTDAFFRHTREEIAAYQKEGVLTVEMEASALFAVAQMRGISLGAGFVISDLLYGEQWDPHFRKEPVERGLDQLLELAMA